MNTKVLNNHSPMIATSAPAESETIILKPIATIENIVDTYREYNNLKDRLLVPDDYQLIRGKRCIKKS